MLALGLGTEASSLYLLIDWRIKDTLVGGPIAGSCENALLTSGERGHWLLMMPSPSQARHVVILLSSCLEIGVVFDLETCLLAIVVETAGTVCFGCFNVGRVEDEILRTCSYNKCR